MIRTARFKDFFYFQEAIWILIQRKITYWSDFIDGEWILKW